MSEALTLPSIGDVVDGRFRIDRKLGEGGTSAVYEVSHLITDKKFAIKWLLPELAVDDDAVDRFIDEARVGGRFAHPSAVQIYDICRANNSFYMLLDLLEGESLLARLERVGRLSVEAACAIMLPCAEVLAAAHQAGIVHRDLKPANIFLCAGDEHRGEMPKVLDFGIAKVCADLCGRAQPPAALSLVKTASGSVIGTPLYMSPEQMLGRPTDPRTDIYALGAVLYEMVSGRPPFQADSYADLVAQVTADGRAPRLDTIAPVSAGFAAVVARAIARDVGARFSSVEDLVQALLPYVSPALAAPYRRDSPGLTPAVTQPSPAKSAGADEPSELLSTSSLEWPVRAHKSRLRAQIAGLVATLSSALGLAWATDVWPHAATEIARPGSQSHVHQVLPQPIAAAPTVVSQEPPAPMAEGRSPDSVPPAALAAKHRSAEPASGRTHALTPAAMPAAQSGSDGLHAAQPPAAQSGGRAVHLAQAAVAPGDRRPMPAAQSGSQPLHAYEAPAARSGSPHLAQTPAAPTHAPAQATERPSARPGLPPDVHVERSDFEASRPASAPPRAVVSRRDF